MNVRMVTQNMTNLKFNYCLPAKLNPTAGLLKHHIKLLVFVNSEARGLFC